MRQAIARLEIDGKEWQPGGRWWGPGTDKRPLEIDVLAESVDKKSLLVGEVKSTVTVKDLKGIEIELRQKIERLAFAGSYHQVVQKISVADSGRHRSTLLITGKAVFSALK